MKETKGEWRWVNRSLGLWSLIDPDGNRAGMVVGRTYRLCDKKGDWIGSSVEVSSATGKFLQLNTLAKKLCLIAAKSLRETKDGIA